MLTGATGFLGGHLAAELVRRGHEVAVIARPSARRDRLQPGLRVFDAQDLQRPFSALGRTDAVIHAATAYGREGEPPGEIVDANVRFPLALMDAGAHFEVPLFINTDTYYTKRGAPYAHLATYTSSKKQFADAGKQRAGELGMRFVNLRLEHLYGPGDSPSKFVTSVVRQCLAQAPEIRLTPGEQRRDFIYVDDVVAAFCAVLESAPASAGPSREYEAGSGDAVTVREFLEAAHRLGATQSRLVFGRLPYREDEIMESRADIAPLRALGWKPAVPLNEGLARLVAAERALIRVTA